MNKILILSIAMYSITTVGKISTANAGVIVTDPQGFKEFKGTFTINVPTPEIVSSNKFVRSAPCFPGAKTRLVRIRNRETVISDKPVTVNLYNVYPTIIETPDCDNNILTSSFDNFSLLAGGEIDGTIKSLPVGVILSEASVFGPSTGFEYLSEITPISNLDELPSTSTNNINIVWDVSNFAETSGNFYLVKTTMSYSELCSVPEPSLLLGLNLLSIVGFIRFLNKNLKVRK